MDTTVQDSATLRAEIEAQPELQPGETGWWRVWGATPMHIRPGDAVLLDGKIEYVQDTFVPRAAPIRVGMVIDDEPCTVGALYRVTVYRRGTRNTLAEAL